MKVTSRDLYNIKVRASAKLTGKTASLIRKEEPFLSAAERMQRAIETQRKFMEHKFAFLAPLAQKLDPQQ